MLIVISPAKKLDMSKTLPDHAVSTVPSLLDDSAELIEQLRMLDSYAIANLMKISLPLADLNQQRYQAWHTPFSEENASCALAAFRGDVYQTLDADSLNKDEQAFTQQHLRILSGLYGVLRPLDLIQAYRLEMGTSLPTPRGRNLYEFWGDRITGQLAAQMEQLNSNCLLNLASQEYFKAVHPKSIPGTIVTPVFKELHNGSYKTIGIHAKRARGLMTRYIIQQRITQVEDIRSFSIGGYRWNAEASTRSNWVFCRS